MSVIYPCDHQWGQQGIDPDIDQSETLDSEDELRDCQCEEVSVFLTAQTHHLSMYLK